MPARPRRVEGSIAAPCASCARKRAQEVVDSLNRYYRRLAAFARTGVLRAHDVSTA